MNLFEILKPGPRPFEGNIEHVYDELVGNLNVDKKYVLSGIKILIQHIENPTEKNVNLMVNQMVIYVDQFKLSEFASLLELMIKSKMVKIGFLNTNNEIKFQIHLTEIMSQIIEHTWLVRPDTSTAESFSLFYYYILVMLPKAHADVLFIMAKYHPASVSTFGTALTLKIAEMKIFQDQGSIFLRDSNQTCREKIICNLILNSERDKSLCSIITSLLSFGISDAFFSVGSQDMIELLITNRYFDITRQIFTNYKDGIDSFGFPIIFSKNPIDMLLVPIVNRVKIENFTFVFTDQEEEIIDLATMLYMRGIHCKSETIIDTIYDLQTKLGFQRLCYIEFHQPLLITGISMVHQTKFQTHKRKFIDVIQEHLFHFNSSILNLVLNYWSVRL